MRSKLKNVCIRGTADIWIWERWTFARRETCFYLNLNQKDIENNKTLWKIVHRVLYYRCCTRLKKAENSARVVGLLGRNEPSS